MLYPQDLQYAMYTTEMTIGSDSKVARRQVSPHTNHSLLLGLTFEGRIFKEQQTTFVQCVVLHNLALKAWTV